jgi:hypothetical protein
MGGEGLKILNSFTSISRYSLSMGTGERYFSYMKAQKFTYSNIVNIDGSASLRVCLCVETRVWFTTFPGSMSIQYSVPNNVSQEFFLEVSNFGFFSALVFCRSTVVNCLRRKYSAFIEYGQCVLGCHDVCMYVHHWPARIDFNSTHRFRYRLLAYPLLRHAENSLSQNLSLTLWKYMYVQWCLIFNDFWSCSLL